MMSVKKMTMCLVAVVVLMTPCVVDITSNETPVLAVLIGAVLNL